MPFHEHISTKFGATIVLWQLTENEQTIATLLSEKERSLIDSQNLSPELNISSENRGKWLHICWSAKEALFKAIPETGIDFREHLHIVPALLTEEGYLSAWETRTEATKAYTVWYRIYDDFVLVCTVPLQ